MKNFLYLYIGGQRPENMNKAEIEKVMNAWMAYFGKLGDKVVNAGAPLGERESVGGGAASKATGYSIVKAADLKSAVAMTKGHPHLAGGGTIEVFEAEPPQGM